MSDDESFVILGSSPMPSMKSNNEDSDNSFSSLKQSQVAKESIKSLETVSLNCKDDATEPLIADGETKSLESQILNATGGNANNVSLQNSDNQSANSSLAASFIMGEIDADVLKTSVFSQFPSICSMQACAEDVVKLQSFMTEYLGLKHVLSKVNLTMKQYYDKTQQWKEEMQRTEQEYKQLLENCTTQIATLRNENMELKVELNTKMDDIVLCDEIRQKDYVDLVQALSDKNSIIDNMRSQIEKLEQQQLASFEYIPKNVKSVENKPEYIEYSEHECIVKNLERQMSQLLAENLDLKDVQNQYIDEINCLKVNLTAAEELIKQSRADIDLLKANDLKKSELFSTYETERNKLTEEVSLLSQQLDIYRKDFYMERTARQNIAGEKDQLLQDLRALQRKNQEMIESAQKQLEEYERQSTSSQGASAQVFSPEPQIESIDSHRCPICFKSFKSLSDLPRHVNACLDK